MRNSDFVMIKFTIVFGVVCVLAQVCDSQTVTADIVCNSTQLTIHFNVPTAVTLKPTRFFFGGLVDTNGCFSAVNSSDDTEGQYEATLGPYSDSMCGNSQDSNNVWSITLKMFGTVNSAGIAGDGDVMFHATTGCNPNPTGEGKVNILAVSAFTPGTVTVLSPSVTVGTVKLLDASGQDLTEARAGTNATIRVPITSKGIGTCKLNSVTLKPDSSSSTSDEQMENGCYNMSIPTTLVTVANNAADLDFPFSPVLFYNGASDAFGTSLYVECGFICCPNDADPCKQTTSCPSTGRKRRSADDNALFFNVNTTIHVTEEKPKKQGAEPCAGYISDTIFCVVVVVLAVLLVITVGVAAHFATRTRVVVAGKDSTVFG